MKRACPALHFLVRAARRFVGFRVRYWRVYARCLAESMATFTLVRAPAPSADIVILVPPTMVDAYFSCFAETMRGVNNAAAAAGVYALLGVTSCGCSYSLTIGEGPRERFKLELRELKADVDARRVREDTDEFGSYLAGAAVLSGSVLCNDYEDNYTSAWDAFAPPLLGSLDPDGLREPATLFLDAVRGLGLARLADGAGQPHTFCLAARTTRGAVLVALWVAPAVGGAGVRCTHRVFKGLGDTDVCYRALVERFSEPAAA